MNNEIKDIAARVKMLRETYNESVQTMADYLGCSVEQYNRYENGDIDISLSKLCQIANKFNLDLTELITGEQPKLKSFCIERAGKYPQIERRKEYKYFDLSYNFVGKKCETFLVQVDPRTDNEAPHQYSHEGQEFNFILEGSLRLFIDDSEVVLNEGDSIYFDSTQKHAMKPENNKSVKFLVVLVK